MRRFRGRASRAWKCSSSRAAAGLGVDHGLGARPASWRHSRLPPESCTCTYHGWRGSPLHRQDAEALLGARPGNLVRVEHTDQDWYANLLWLDRRKCLLLAHAGTLFSAFVPDVHKADLVPIGPSVVAFIRKELEAEGPPAGQTRRSRFQLYRLGQDREPDRTGLHERDGAILRLRGCRVRRAGSMRRPGAESPASTGTSPFASTSRVLCPHRAGRRISGSTRHRQQPTCSQGCRWISFEAHMNLCVPQAPVRSQPRPLRERADTNQVDIPSQQQV